MKISSYVSLFLLWLVCSSVLASQWPSYQSSVVRVKDGDTVTLDVRVWPQITVRVDVRIQGINTAETRVGTEGKEGEELELAICEKQAGLDAKAYAKGLLPEGTEVVLHGIMPKDTKFSGRMNGKIKINDRDFGEAMLTAGHAKIYHGEKRGPWCGNEVD